jgi:O-antigen ligase
LGMLDEKPLRKIIWLVIAGLQIFILFLSITRLELLSIPFGLAVMAIMKGKIKQTFALIIILAVLGGVMMPSSLKDKFSIIFKRETIEAITDAATGIKRVDIYRTLEMQQLIPSDYDLSALTRLYFWINAFDTFKTYPVFGAGQSALGDVVDNNYLRVLGENGLVGFAVFIMLIYYIWKSCVKVYNNEAMSKEFRDYALFVLVMLANMLIMALMSDVFEMSKIAYLFWLLVGVFFKMKGIESKELKGAV